MYTSQTIRQLYDIYNRDVFVPCLLQTAARTDFHTKSMEQVADYTPDDGPRTGWSGKFQWKLGPKYDELT